SPVCTPSGQPCQPNTQPCCNNAEEEQTINCNGNTVYRCA
uniref:Omega-actinopoditoxin-Mb1a n=1 Tax=Missulena bradleyi TaxID=230234 RepID=TOM1A_MISBR|nr:RecName: Full=Omega-actinopoditoxin-Mb1a; Short=Omega-AOTX-Mb1a; AltName: Full=Omega-missulenatoxin-Mb1a; Short=Omega-MSTX-Mb1a [Missulena bradleyi]